MAEANPQNFHTFLTEVFPNTSMEVINDIIVMVEEQNPFDTFEGKIENMINLLSGDGAHGPIPEEIFRNVAPPARSPSDDQLYQNLRSVFPDANPNYLRRYCENRQTSLDEAIDELIETDYEKFEVDPITVWEQLQSALPNADPSYLKTEANRLASLAPQNLDDFVQSAIEKDDYPTMQQYLKRKQQHDELSIYKDCFDIEKFLEAVPNPTETFSDPRRKLSLDDNAIETDIKFAMTFLYNQYRFIRKKYIEQLFKWKNKNLVEICDRLDKLNRSLRMPRRWEESEETKNVLLLQVTSYLKHRKLIKRELKLKDEKYRLAKEEAMKYNLLETCQCCFDEELIPEECYYCMKDCVFCKDCVKNGSQTAIGNGEMRFPCFNNCNSEFSLQTLRMVLPKKIFERLTQRIASEEIKKANVEGLATCPFCEFAMILPYNEKIFRCINEECMIESCRECRHKSHIPLRCNEIEYDEDVRRRTYIENKMTEALTRTCYKCQKTFIKTNGCNKMTCNCGAKMCYLCGAAVSDYSHFNPGGCALHTNDVQINLERILENARKAKEDLGNVNIKFDPTVDIYDYYREN